MSFSRGPSRPAESPLLKLVQAFQGLINELQALCGSGPLLAKLRLIFL
jgi:hypothetical protein